MKKFAFKILSILLAAALLVVALPTAVFAEDVSPCATPSCEHVNTRISYPTYYHYVTNEEHVAEEYYLEVCTRCEEVISYYELDSWFESHTIDPSVDQETEMEGECIDCGEMISW